MTAADRTLRARVAAHSSWAKTPDRTARTAPAREAMRKKFEDQVDPDRILSETERAFRVEQARRAYYLSLALKSAKSRRERRKQPPAAAKSERVPTPAEGESRRTDHLTRDALLRLADLWDAAANAWFHEHRFGPGDTVDHAAGFEEGWGAAAHLLRTYVDGPSS